jgi:hypothetical protein
MKPLAILTCALSLMAGGALRAEKTEFVVLNNTPISYYVGRPASPTDACSYLLHGDLSGLRPCSPSEGIIGMLMPYSTLSFTMEGGADQHLIFQFDPGCPRHSVHSETSYRITFRHAPSSDPAAGPHHYRLWPGPRDPRGCPPPGLPWVHYYDAFLSVEPARDDARKGTKRPRAAEPDPALAAPEGTESKEPQAIPPAEGTPAKNRRTAPVPAPLPIVLQHLVSPPAPGSVPAVPGMTLVNRGAEDCHLVTLETLTTPCAVRTASLAGTTVKTWAMGEHVHSRIPAGGQVTVTMDEPGNDGARFILLDSETMDNEANVLIECDGSGGKVIQEFDEEPIRTKVRPDLLLPQVWNIWVESQGIPNTCDFRPISPGEASQDRALPG